MIENGKSLNVSADEVFRFAAQRADELRVQLTTYANGAKVLDCGVNVTGGLTAGVEMARICLAGQGQVNLTSGDRSLWEGPWVQVSTDYPVEACMMGQYAGWPVKQGDFFAMGSGPMRVKRGREELLLGLKASDQAELAVGTLECDCLPGESVLAMIAEECSVAPDRLSIAVAPTRSIAGCVQVVARSVETALHKFHELGMEIGLGLEVVRSGYGIAPLCPPTPDFAKAIGRTNDAILYGGHVSLWVEADDEQIEAIGPKLPSCASKDFGKPFAEIFKSYEYDFYKVDPGLFSPAEVTILNLRSGRSWRFGSPRPELIKASFATQEAL